jgi:DHA2 family multidrug resistance protein
MNWGKGELFRITGLYLMIIPFLNALNATGYVNSQIQGHFGVSSTEFMYMNLIPVFVLIAGLPLALEIAKQFKLKSLLYTIIIFSVILNTASAYSPNFYWFIACRSLLAFFTILGIFAALVPIVLRYNPAFNMAIMYGIVQFIIQGSSHLYKFAGVLFAGIYDWRTSIMMVNINFFICILLARIFIKKDIAPFKQAFRFDFRGWALVILLLIPVLFLAAEGQSRNWFDDAAIRLATALFLVLTGVYLLHVRFKGFPIIDLKVFGYRNVVFGSLFFFMIGVMNNTGSIILGYMSGILGFSDLYQARTHLGIFIGICLSIPAITFLLFRRIHLQFAAVVGFCAFGFYHLLMYFRFCPGITVEDFIFPLILKGIGIGFLYVLSSLYISENVPKHLGTSRMMSGILARNVLAIFLGAAILNTVVAKMTATHFSGISRQINNGNAEAVLKFATTKAIAGASGFNTSSATKLADNTLRNDMNKTAKMLAYKDIYLAMALLCFLPAVIIILFRLGRRPVQRIEVEPIPI